MNYIDLDLAIKYSYNQELLKKLIINFIKEYEDFALRILDDSKEETLFKIHKIKGVTLNLGAQYLYDICTEMEHTINYEQSLKTFIYIFNKSYKELLNL